MARILKKIFKIIVDILTFIVFVVLVLIIYSKVKMIVTGNDYFDMFGYSIFTVATGSMEPAISQNDIIIIKDKKDYLENEIVTFKSDKAYITHRIIEKRGDTYVTKGDANNTKDVEIDKSAIVGKVVKILPNAAVWQKIFSSPKVIIAIFATLMLFDFAFSYRGIQKKKNIKLVDKVKEKLNGIKIKQVNKTEEVTDEKKVELVNKIEEAPKMSDEEIVELVKKTDMVQAGEDVKFDKKEKDFLNYTVRLDLSELQKHIDDEMNKE